jgi:hypothetical protein
VGSLLHILWRIIDQRSRIFDGYTLFFGREHDDNERIKWPQMIKELALLVPTLYCRTILRPLLGMLISLITLFIVASGVIIPPLFNSTQDGSSGNLTFFYISLATIAGLFSDKAFSFLDSVGDWLFARHTSEGPNSSEAANKA